MLFTKIMCSCTTPSSPSSSGLQDVWAERGWSQGSRAGEASAAPAGGQDRRAWPRMTQRCGASCSRRRTGSVGDWSSSPQRYGPRIKTRVAEDMELILCVSWSVVCTSPLLIGLIRALLFLQNLIINTKSPIKCWIFCKDVDAVYKNHCLPNHSMRLSRMNRKAILLCFGVIYEHTAPFLSIY